MRVHWLRDSRADNQREQAGRVLHQDGLAILARRNCQLGDIRLARDQRQLMAPNKIGQQVLLGHAVGQALSPIAYPIYLPGMRMGDVAITRPRCTVYTDVQHIQYLTTCNTALAEGSSHA